MPPRENPIGPNCPGPKSSSQYGLDSPKVNCDQFGGEYVAELVVTCHTVGASASTPPEKYWASAATVTGWVSR